MSARIFVALTVSCCGLAAHADAAEPMPPGIGIRITLAGPTFVDARGMTLYHRNHAVEQGVLPCHDLPETIIPLQNLGYNQVEEFPMRVMDPASQRSCIQIRPPLLAPPDAKPVGRWTIHVRENGMRQWAYDGKPLHYSIKDRAPGDFSDDDVVAWGIAVAPLQAPPAVDTRTTSLGLALTTYDGKPFYYRSSGSKGEPSADWEPALAPIAAVADDLPAGWTLVEHSGGRQWAWQGHPLYTYGPDSGDERPRDHAARRFVDVFGASYGKPIPGWHIALLKAAPAPPDGLRIMPFFPRSRIYADARGHTLYAMSCTQPTVDRVDCDNRGDSPRYWLNFCGGEELCRQTWRPLVAPKDAKPVEGLWSVTVINPRHPYKPLEPGDEGIPTWTYRGRLVFTYAEDEKPGDTRGAMNHAQGMAANVIPAFAMPEPGVRQASATP